MGKFIVGLVAAGLASFFGAKWKMESDVEAWVDMMVMMSSPYADVEYDGVSSTLTGELTIDGIRINIHGVDDQISIGRFGIDTPSFLSLMKLNDMDSGWGSGEDILPSYFGVIIEHVRMPTGGDIARMSYRDRLEELGIEGDIETGAACTGRYGFSPRAFQELGYDEFDMSLSMRFRDLGSRYSVEVEAKNEGVVSINGEMILAGDMVAELSKGPRYRPRLDELRIEYIDHSHNERVVRYCQTEGLSDEEIFAAQMETFKFMGSEMGIEFDEYVLEPLAEFLKGGEALIFTADPNDPVAISQINLYKPSDVPALLQLSAEVR